MIIIIIIIIRRRRRRKRKRKRRRQEMMDDSFNPIFLTADVDVDLDFLRQQTRHPDENYWTSDEQAEEIPAGGGEFLLKWT
jgi:hypothetical protein